MKTFIEYIKEDNEKKVSLWISTFIGMLSNTNKISKEALEDMLLYLCKENKIKKLSDYFVESNQSNYLAFQPADDDFLQESNYPKISSQISEYIIKYILKK